MSLFLTLKPEIRTEERKKNAYHFSSSYDVLDAMLDTTQALSHLLFPRKHHSPDFQVQKLIQKCDIAWLWWESEDLELESISSLFSSGFPPPTKPALPGCWEGKNLPFVTLINIQLTPKYFLVFPKNAKWQIIYNCSHQPRESPNLS